jgi:hypothetical protein
MLQMLLVIILDELAGIRRGSETPDCFGDVLGEIGD